MSNASLGPQLLLMFGEVVGALAGGTYLEGIGGRGVGMRVVLEVSSRVLLPIPY